MSGYGGTPCEIIVKLQKIDGRKSATMKDRNGQSYKAPVYMVSSYKKLMKVNDFDDQDGEDVRGQIEISLSKGKKLDHSGIKVELIGQIENLLDKNQSSTFLQLVRDLEPPGALTDNASYDFQFNKSEKQFETYNGIMVRVRYYVQVTISRQYAKVTKQEEFIV